MVRAPLWPFLRLEAAAVKRVAVTGATGFVGRALTARLLVQGCEVRALARHGSGVPIGSEIYPIGDLGTSCDWRAATAGVEAVVHLAARVHTQGQPSLVAESETDYERVNVDASVALAQAAAAGGARRFVFVSSIKVNGESSVGRPFTASDPPAPSDLYGRSKARAEAALRQVAEQTGLDVAIVRPPLVYGPEVRANFLALLRLCDTPLLLPFAGAANRRSLVYRDNLVDALAQLTLFPDRAGGTWIVTDGEDLTLEELVRCLRRHLERPARLFPAPHRLLRRLADAAGCRAAFDRLYGSLRADGTPFREAFGWAAPISVDAGLAATVDWYRGRAQDRA